MSYPVFNLCGVNLELMSERGVVLSQDKFSETHVHTKSSTIDGQYGPERVVKEVSSEVINNHHFWIKKGDGQEEEIRLTSISPSIREGHEVEIVYARREGSDGDWSLMSIMNHTTGKEVARPSHEINGLFGMFHPRWAWAFAKTSSGANWAQIIMLLVVVAPIMMIYFVSTSRDGWSDRNVVGMAIAFWIYSGIGAFFAYSFLFIYPSIILTNGKIAKRFHSPYKVLTALKAS